MYRYKCVVMSNVQDKKVLMWISRRMDYYPHSTDCTSVHIDALGTWWYTAPITVMGDNVGDDRTVYTIYALSYHTLQGPAVQRDPDPLIMCPFIYYFIKIYTGKEHCNKTIPSWARRLNMSAVTLLQPCLPLSALWFLSTAPYFQRR